MSNAREVRRRALPRAVGWGLATLVLTLLLFWYVAKPRGPVYVNIIGGAVPGMMTLVNVLELATGVPLSEWERRWAGLSGGRKFVLSVAILFAAFLLFMMVCLPIALAGHV